MWLLYGLVGLITTVRAFKPGAFAIPIDLNDHYIRPGKNFFRQNGSYMCDHSPYYCMTDQTVLDATGNSLCVTGYFGNDGPKITNMARSQALASTYNTTGKWCWDQVNATDDPSSTRLDFHNISNTFRLDTVEIIIEPDIPDG